ncbi:MAG: hypothetical protein Q7S38_00365 [bacterium]|nr:hypothetical protein [bacterium]
MTVKSGFDPLLYLGLRLNPKFKKDASKELLDQIAQYLVIRTIENLPDEKAKNLNNLEELLKLAKGTIPDYSSQVKVFLDDFKKEYKQNLGIY